MADDWGYYIELEEGEELTRLHHYTFKKKQQDREVEFLITVREYAHPTMGGLRFFAQTDKQTNQKLAPFTPSGWGNNLMSAVSDCVHAIRKFPYQGE